MKKEIDEELKIKRQELELRKREVKLKEDQFKIEKKRSLLNPSSIAIIAALFGSAITATITGYQNAELERLKQEFQIIVSASEDRTQEEAAKNLLFFVEIGALRDKNGKIREFALKGEAPIISSGPNDFKLPNEDVAKNPKGFLASLYQGEINWTEIKEIGISFAMIKATEGDQYIDPQFYNSWESAETNEIIRGAYHEYDDCTSSDTQAAHFASVVKIEEKDFAPILSVMNDPSCLSHSDPRYIQGIIAWLDMIEKQYSRTPIICTRKSLWDKITDKDFSRYPLWAAAYKFTTSPVFPVSWSNWTFWEYRDDTLLAGTYSEKDTMILFNGSFEELQAFINKN